MTFEGIWLHHVGFQMQSTSKCQPFTFWTFSVLTGDFSAPAARMKIYLPDVPILT